MLKLSCCLTQEASIHTTAHIFLHGQLSQAVLQLLEGGSAVLSRQAGCPTSGQSGGQLLLQVLNLQAAQPSSAEGASCWLMLCLTDSTLLVRSALNGLSPVQLLPAFQSPMQLPHKG